MTEFHPIGQPGRPDIREAIDPRNIGYAASIYGPPADRPFTRAFDLAGDVPKTVAKRVVDGREVMEVRWEGKTRLATAIQMEPAHGGGSISRTELVSFREACGVLGRQDPVY